MTSEGWELNEIREIYELSFLDLVYRAATVHRQNHNPKEVQMSTLVSIKTGGCPEDCSYCPQAARYNTDIEKNKLMEVDEVVALAQKAKQQGSSRLCMGAAWREVKDNKDFDRVIEMVQSVNAQGMEVCCTLGMISYEQAQRLKDAGLYAYNHNVDTSKEYYENIISTRTFADREDTLKNVRKAKLTICSGGIIGMGETSHDRIGMIHFLANLNPPPESVPINALVPVPGTPLENQPRVSIWDLVRMVATARITMPRAAVRLSAGRTEMSTVEQSLCFLAGANSIFSGEKLLTTPNPHAASDEEMFKLLGLQSKPAFSHGPQPAP